MQEMLYPTSYLKSKGLGTACALITDGRFSGSNRGLFVGHISPEAAEGGVIGLIEDGDIVTLDLTNRSLELEVSEEVLNQRRKNWKPTYKESAPGFLSLYRERVGTAATGAILK